MKKIVVAFRTHLWNEDIKKIADRLSDSVKGKNTQFVILADETQEELSVGKEFVKVAHTDNFDEFGLPRFPANRVLWWNADYPLYVLKNKIDADFYLMIENDVVINFNIGEYFEKLSNENVDFLSYRISKTDKGVMQTAKRMDDPIYRGFIQILGVSKKAIGALYSTRLLLVKDHYEEVNDWPYCETFIPTVLSKERGFNVVDLRKLENKDIDFSNFTLKKSISIEDSIAYQKNTIVHPVIETYRAIEKRLNISDDVLAFLKPDSALSRLMSLATNKDELFEKIALRYQQEAQSPRIYNNFLKSSELLGYDTSRLKINWALGKKVIDDKVNESFIPQLITNGELNQPQHYLTQHRINPCIKINLDEFVQITQISLYRLIVYSSKNYQLFIHGMDQMGKWHEFNRFSLEHKSEFPKVLSLDSKNNALPPVWQLRVSMSGLGKFRLNQICISGNSVSLDKSNIKNI